MPITASDLVVYAATAMPDDDTSPNGGAIDLLRRVNFAQMGAPDVVQVVSTAAGDTNAITVEGRTVAGDLVTDSRALSGVTPVDMTGLGSSVERILKVELASAMTGAVTVRRQTGLSVIGVIPAGERGFVAPLRKPSSNPDTSRDFYAKIFVANRSAVTLLSAVIKQGQDTDQRVTHVPGASNDGTVATANRLTAPASTDLLAGASFDDTDKAVGNIPPGSARGVWLKLSVAAGENPYLTKYIMRVEGQST
jgi:hypothetical protein